jgi:hypothetical protein
MHSQPGFHAASTTPSSRGFLLCGHRTSLAALTEEGGMS